MLSVALKGWLINNAMGLSFSMICRSNGEPEFEIGKVQDVMFVNKLFSCMIRYGDIFFNCNWDETRWQ